MKNLLTLLLLTAALVSHAQESFFRGNNNYQAPPTPPFQAPAIVQAGLILNLDAANPASYPGTGSTWTNLVTGTSVANFSLNSTISFATSNGGVLRFADGGWATTTSSFGRLASYTIEVWIKIAGTSGPAPNSNYSPCIFSEKYGSDKINLVLAYNRYTSPTSPHQYAAGYYNGGWNTISTSSNTTGTIGNNPDTSNLGYNIGKRWDMPDLVYGDYAIVNMYNRALSLAEIGTNFNAVKSRFGL